MSLSILLPVAAIAAPGDRCTHESWIVDGAPLEASLCVPAARTAHVSVAETFVRDGQSLTRSLDLDPVDGVELTRTVDTVPLAAVGSPKQLHLTIAYRDGTAVIEHALLLPGAVVLK